jgi:hypothetical protein
MGQTTSTWDFRSMFLDTLSDYAAGTAGTVMQRSRRSHGRVQMIGLIGAYDIAAAADAVWSKPLSLQSISQTR